MVFTGKLYPKSESIERSSSVAHVTFWVVQVLVSSRGTLPTPRKPYCIFPETGKLVLLENKFMFSSNQAEPFDIIPFFENE